MIIDKYIDESCHLENDNIPIMCIGFIGCGQENRINLLEKLKKIQLKHNTPTELKWNKLSMSRFPFYKELIDCFFESELFFRCVLVKYKDRLNHEKYNDNSHDLFYYKMIYYLLRPHYNQKDCSYRVFLDIKDTRGKEKLEGLRNIFSASDKDRFLYFQHIRSEENLFIQLTDFFIGAITFKARDLYNKKESSSVKKKVVDYLEEKSGYYLDVGTEPWEDKFNIFDFTPKKQ